MPDWRYVLHPVTGNFLLNEEGNFVVYDAELYPEGPPPECCCGVECCNQPYQLMATRSLGGQSGACVGGPAGSFVLTQISPGIYTGFFSGCGTFTLACEAAEDPTDCPNSWAMSVAGCPSGPNDFGELDEATCDCEVLFLRFTFCHGINDLACPDCCPDVFEEPGCYEITVTLPP